MPGIARWLVPAGMALVAVSGCGGGSTGPGGGSGSLAAQIDGQAWASDAPSVSVTAGSPGVPGSLIIIGSHVASATSYTTLSLTVGYIAGPGTYPLGVNFASTAGGLGQVTQQSGAAFETRSTPLSGAGGTFVVTSTVSGRITGTFAFTATPIAGALYTGSRAVTNGTFDLALPSAFTAVPASNHGSFVAMQLNGAGWHAATVAGQGSGGVFGFTATTDAYVVTLTTATPVTAGSYALGTDFSMTVLETATNHSWGGTGNATGTVTVTSIGGGRVAGTVSGTLTGTSGSLTVASGAFDVKIG